MSLQKVELADFVSLTKKEIIALADRSVESWCDSGEDTLAMLSMIVKLETYTADVKSKLAKRLVDEVAQYGKDGVTKNGVSLSLFSSTRYDYSNSPAWISVKEQIKPLEDTLKEIEQIAKATKQKSTWVDSDGVEWDVYPAIKTGSEIVKTTIK